MGRGDLLARWKTAGLTLALFALVFQALLPPGYMLAPTGDGIAITLCSGRAVSVDLSGDKHAPAQQSDAPCAFAVMAHASAPTPALVVAAPRNEAFVAFVPSQRSGVASLAIAAPPPWATGPPLSI